MRWGKENECNARQRHTLDRLSVGENMVVTSCGLHLMADKSYLEPPLMDLSRTQVLTFFAMVV